MPRPRSKKYRDLPEGLYFKGKKGYVFRRIDNSCKSLGHDKSRAIALARRYNATYRVDPEISHPVNLDLIKPHRRKSIERLSSFFSRVSERYAAEEKPSKDTLAMFDSRLAKLNTLIGDKTGLSITLDDVNLVLEAVATGKSNNVFNRWIAFMSKVFDYAVDESVMVDNPAKRKKRKPKEEKQRQRLTIAEYKAIWSIAPQWMRIAMDLSLETTHAVNEICAMKYEHITLLDKPVMENGVEVYGYLRIHRQKVKGKEASRVVIPVTRSLLNIIEASKDNINSPYVVHRMPEKRSNEMSQYCDHITQVNRKYLSRFFSKLRDQAKVKSSIPSESRPTYHEIRGLSIHLYDKAGHDPQARAAHTDSRSTKIYKEGHEKWVQVPAVELAIWT
ncbi:tyrosine-type recombinase/integrase [Vibrio sp. La 4.2.2]|uniref:tyrosine-type recombinase/integrase n=1 Tax=Vibrio sp. La 4.2.2 TaxID=2998830 RepID=UPI0022CDE16F|nr:tyrosine-type recombinase/integrase [Vibrio sp. La 4.2.2]MDA0109045.1 tyrosine-type recombinase/integrase [Vibrio sp. La 4.2.2]